MRSVVKSIAPFKSSLLVRINTKSTISKAIVIIITLLASLLSIYRAILLSLLSRYRALSSSSSTYKILKKLYLII